MHPRRQYRRNHFANFRGAPIILSTILPSTLGYSSSGWLLSYMIATVITGLGILAFG